MRQNRPRNLCNLIVICLFFCILSGCASQNQLSSNKVNQTAYDIAQLNHFQKQLIKTNPFMLTTFQKFSTSPSTSNTNHTINQTLTIYIEGDGRTWITRSKLSNNPTPKNPLALKLAVLDNSANVAYLARPCQYTPHSLDSACNPLVWSDQRFSETVIQSMNEAVENLKKSAKARQIHLVGFSGGGAIAILIAARRNDIASLRTVAGDLNPTALSQYHQTSPLTSSLDPNTRTVIQKLIHLPQQHFSGEKDKTVPPFIAEEFVARLRKLGSPCTSQTTIKDATHHQGWEAIWPTLLDKPLGTSDGCQKNNVSF
ncbi:MAG TPA: alpha/beta hydrolase [Gammaproteobacteria bacterium]|nr:alpha/beta hydrolase [Gammaproteobacteria bacterium]HQY22648.1 alpha/beta hydrolase [Gammaproteobacteria bacterium]HQZ87343.1 alpha/beta hydrolase [Gammaproteobacteria bacterium]HRA43006.1 alpha/beta hydrolase [Gammaproteobacteria bacterium]